MVAVGLAMVVGGSVVVGSVRVAEDLVVGGSVVVVEGSVGVVMEYETKHSADHL